MLSRRELGGTLAKAAILPPLLRSAILSCSAAETAPALNSVAGIDRVTVQPGKTYLRGWAGYGDPPSTRPRTQGQAQGAQNQEAAPPPESRPAPGVTWSKVSGSGTVNFADPKAPITTATFSTPGNYVLKLTADNGQAQYSSTLSVIVETPPPAKQLDALYTRNFKIHSPLWDARVKALVTNWIPHCIDQIDRNDLTEGPGGIDNFIEAGKALRGEPHGSHKGYVFSNAWVHQTVEAMSIALMIDPQGDPDILQAHAKFRKTLEEWIPIILAAQEPDGYLQTAFTAPAPRAGRGGGPAVIPVLKHWDPPTRGNHEGYTAGYFLESAINHYDDQQAGCALVQCGQETGGLLVCQPWPGAQRNPRVRRTSGDGTGVSALPDRFVNESEESAGKGQRYIELAKFLLDCRYNAAVTERDREEYDQSHLPVVQQYEAVGHAVRAMYTYSGMADVAVETHEPDYQSAVRSLWDNVVSKKYYVTGGVGSGETSEGFGPNYSLGNRAYCESCSTCGEIFFHWKMNLAYHDAKYTNMHTEKLPYTNALLGATDLDGKNFFYDNPLDEYKVRYAWHACPCCVGNLARTLLMFPTWTYARSSDGVYVNMYAGSTITVENAGGTDVEMVQETNYPWDGKVSITVNPKTARNFTVRLRVPNRTVSPLYAAAPDANGLTSIHMNGAVVKAAVANGYAAITRTWRAGDKIELLLPMTPQRVHADDRIVANRGKVALRYGPLMYSIEQVDQDITKSLSPDAPLTTEWKADLLGGVMVIKGKYSDGSPMIAIPNFARMNRGPVPTAPVPVAGARPPRPAPSSIVWIKEA